MNASNDVLFKIKKLLALAQDGGASENEAAIAASHVQRLLQEHGLNMAQVEAAGAPQSEDELRDKRTLQDRPARLKYQQQLMAAIAETHFCIYRVYEGPGNVGMDLPCTSEEFARVKDALEFGDDLSELGFSAKKLLDTLNYYAEGLKEVKRHILVGRKINIEVSVMTFDYLDEAMRRCAAQQGFFEKDLNLFIEGAANRLVQRLREKRYLAERESQQSQHIQTNGSHKEITLVDLYGSEKDLNNDKLNGFPPGMTVARRREYQLEQLKTQQKHDELVASGMDVTVAWYVVWGYSLESAIATVNRQKEATDRPQRGQRSGSTTRWSSGSDRERRRINSRAYRAGYHTADDIGLDDQVAQTNRKRLR